MATPSDKEIKAVKDKIDKFNKKLNPNGSPKRVMDDNLAKALFRSAVRDKWMYCPTKLSFLLSKRIPDMDNSTRTKWLQQCNKCKCLFKETAVNVDHYLGEKSFTEWEQAMEYASSILDVKFEDLQILCIECHKTKTRGEQLGIDWTAEEGWKRIKMEQEITRVSDLKANPQKQWLVDNDIVPDKNPDNRKKQIREYLEKMNECS